MNSGVQIGISDIAYTLKKKWKTILIFTIAGLIIGVCASGVQYLQGSMSKNYRISASAAYITLNTNGNFSEKAPYPIRNDYLMAEDMTEAVMYVLKSDKLMDAVVNKSGLVGIRASDIKSNISLARHGESSVIEIYLTWRSADEGVKIMSSYLSSSTEIVREVLGTGKISVIDAPKAHRVIGGGAGIPTWSLLLVFGFVMGLGLVILNMIVRPTIINTGDIPKEFGLEVLCRVPKDSEYFSDPSVMQKKDLKNRTQQSFSSAAYILMNRLGKHKKNHVVYVTSALSKEGRTSAAVNLACQIASTERNVLLIDLDFQNPRAGQYFMGSVDYSHSINALYRGEIELPEAIVHVNGYLDIMPSILQHEHIPLDDSTFEIFKECINDYDYVIIDAPSAGETAETVSLNSIADAALLVIGFDSTTKTDIKSALERLDKSGTKIVGCIVNKDDSLAGNTRHEDSQKSGKRLFGGRKDKRNENRDFSTSSGKMMEETFGTIAKNNSEEAEIEEKLIRFGLEEDSE